MGCKNIKFKEFLKPNRKKIGLFVLFFLFLPYPLTFCYIPSCMIPLYPPPLWKVVLTPFITPITFYAAILLIEEGIQSFFLPTDSLFRDPIFVSIFVVIPLLYPLLLYLISCRMVYFWERFKGNKVWTISVGMLVGLLLGIIITIIGKEPEPPRRPPVPQKFLSTWLAGEGFEARVADGGEEYLIKTGELRLAYDFHQYKQLGAELDRKKDQIRKITNAVLNTKRIRDLSSEEGRNEFKHELIEKINPILEKGKIEDVYFQIIIQKCKKTRRLR